VVKVGNRLENIIGQPGLHVTFLFSAFGAFKHRATTPAVWMFWHSATG